MLESVCMRDEPPPQTMADRASQMLSGGNIPPQATMSMAAPSTGPAIHSMNVKPEIINEVPYER